MDAIPSPTAPGISVYIPPMRQSPFPPGSLFGLPPPRSPSPTSAPESVADPAEVGSANLSSALSSPPPPPPPRYQPGRPRPGRRSSGMGALPETPLPRRSARIAARQALREAQTSAGAAGEGGARLRPRAGRTARTRTRGSATNSSGRQRAGIFSTTTRVTAATPQGVAKRRCRGQR